jgi:predicted  nucleic acid-binding Zn-ribbon protein
MSGETESLRKKVATLTVINGALQKENDDLRSAASTHHADGKGGANNGDASSIVAQVEAECEARLREADAQIDELRRELATIAKGGDAAQSSARDKTVKLQEAKNEISAVKRKVAELEGNERRLRSQLRDAEADAERAAKASENNRATADGMREELGAAQSDANREIANLRRRLLEQEQTARKEIDALRESLENKRTDATAKEMKRAKSQVASAETKAAIAEAECAKLSAELAHLESTSQTQREALRNEIRAAEDTVRGLEATLSEQRHAGGFAEEVGEAVAAVTRELERERRERKKDAAEATARTKEAHARHEQLAAENTAVQRDLREAESRVSRAEAAREEMRRLTDEAVAGAEAAKKKSLEAERSEREAKTRMNERLQTTELALESSREKTSVLKAELVRLEETLAKAELEAIRLRREAKATAEDAKMERKPEGRSERPIGDAPSEPPAVRNKADTGVSSREGTSTFAEREPEGNAAEPEGNKPRGGVGGFSVDALVAANKADFAKRLDVGAATWLTAKEKRLIAVERETQAALRTELARSEARCAELAKNVEELTARLLDAETVGSSSNDGSGDGGSLKRVKELRDSLIAERAAGDALRAEHEILLEVLGEKEETAERLARAVSALRNEGRESHSAFRSALEVNTEVLGSIPGKVVGRAFVSKDVDEPLDD